MIFTIRRRRHLGIAKTAEELKCERPYRGDIQITESHSVELGRSTICAWLFTPTSEGKGPFPALLDAKVISMVQNGMIMSGIEQVGDSFYSQTWICKRG